MFSSRRHFSNLSDLFGNYFADAIADHFADAITDMFQENAFRECWAILAFFDKLCFELIEAIHALAFLSILVPRPLLPFQCCTQKRERAWYATSRELRQRHVNSWAIITANTQLIIRALMPAHAIVIMPCHLVIPFILIVVQNTHTQRSIC